MHLVISLTCLSVYLDPLVGLFVRSLVRRVLCEVLFTEMIAWWPAHEWHVTVRLCVCVCARVCARACVRACVRVRARPFVSQLQPPQRRPRSCWSQHIRTEFSCTWQVPGRLPV